MSISRSAPPVPAIRTVIDPAHLQWRSPARDLWVGQTPDHRFAGMIERAGAHYAATDEYGARVGDFDSLPDAETALGIRTLRAQSEPHRAGPSRMAVTAAVSGAAAVVIAVVGLIALTVS